MIENYRLFTVGPDPFGRTFQVRFLWQQNGISIRHADTVDVKWELTHGDTTAEKVLALPHPDLLKLSAANGRPVSDPWCMKLAALHLRHMILTDEDMEKTLVTVSYQDLERHAQQLQQAQPA